MMQGMWTVTMMAGNSVRRLFARLYPLYSCFNKYRGTIATFARAHRMRDRWLAEASAAHADDCG